MSLRPSRALIVPSLAAAVALTSFAAAAPALAAGATTAPVAAPSLVPGGLPTDGAWQPVYRNDFTDLRDVTRFASSATVNSALSPSDTNNSALQKPIVAADTTTVADPAATDGSALAVSTQQQSYPTPTGTAYGWTSGRMAITGQNQAPPVRIRARIRMTPSIGAKTAVMWWPAGGGWPWEVDFAETFGGATLTDFWGARQHVQQNWHSDVNHDGKALEQLQHMDAIDATSYHVYDMFITPQHMWIEIDGVKTFETTDTRWIPTGAGFFSVGKALTGTRAGAHSNDSVFLDWLEIDKPATAAPTPTVTVAAFTAPAGSAPTLGGTVGTGGAATTYHFDYGTTTAYGSSSGAVALAASAAPVPVSATLSALAPSTTYHYRLVATNASGTVTSPDAVLTTGALPTTGAAAADVQPSQVTVAGTVGTGGLDTQVQVEYTPAGGAALLTAAVPVPAGSGSSPVSVPLTGLVPGTTYAYRMLVTNAFGTGSGPVQSFTAPSAPAVVSAAVTARSRAAVSLVAGVSAGNLPTEVQVDYGTTTAYGLQTPAATVGAGTAPVSLPMSLTGLTAATRYHYRVAVTNAAGTSYGPDQITGTTGVPTVAVGALTRGPLTASTASLAMTGSVRPNSLATTYVLRYGRYWSSTSASTAPVSVGAGIWAKTISRTLSGLARHACYRVQVVATNTAGTTTSKPVMVCTR